MRIADGIRRLDQLGDELRSGAAIGEPYAEALAGQAKRNASRRPTPQAPMASAALVVRGQSVSVPSSAIVSSSTGLVRAGAVAGGSEYGSTVYPQFGPRHRPGAWLGSAGARPDPATIQAGENAIEQLVRETCR